MKKAIRTNPEEVKTGEFRRKLAEAFGMGIETKKAIATTADTTTATFVIPTKKEEEDHSRLVALHEPVSAGPGKHLNGRVMKTKLSKNGCLFFIDVLTNEYILITSVITEIENKEYGFDVHTATGSVYKLTDVSKVLFNK